MPLHAIQTDFASGALVEITPEDEPAGGYVVEMRAAYGADSPPGPAGRWFIDRLKQAVLSNLFTATDELICRK